MKKVLKAFLTIAIITAILVTAVCATETTSAQPTGTLDRFSDVHLVDGWAKDGMEIAVSNGIVQGSNDKLNPLGNLTRAELCTMIVRGLNANAVADISKYTDVNFGDWYASEIQKGVAAKIIEGSGNLMNPNSSVTREQAMTIIGRAFCFVPSDAYSLSNFADSSNVSEWAAKHVAALVENGVVLGDNSAKINPKSFITRQEFTTMLARIARNYASSGINYGDVIDGGLVISQPIDGLKDVTINGNLYITEGVNLSDLKLDNVTVNGSIIVRSGNVEITGNSSCNGVVFGGPTDDISLKADESFNTNSIIVAESSKSVTTNVSADTATVYSNNGSFTIDNGTDIEKLSIKGEGNEISIGGAVNSIDVAKEAESTKIEVLPSGQVGSANIAAPGTTVSGQGKLDQATVTADNVNVATNGTNVKNETTNTPVTKPDDTNKPSDPNDTPHNSQLPSRPTVTNELLGLYVTYSTDGGETYTQYSGTISGDTATLDLAALYNSLGVINMNDVLLGSINITTKTNTTCYQDGLQFSFNSNTETTLSSILEQIAAHGFQIVPVEGDEETNLYMLSDRMETAYSAYAEFAADLFEAKGITCASFTDATFKGRFANIDGTFNLHIIVPRCSD